MLDHRFAQLTAACAFLLIVIGGTVNPTGSSLACPEPTLVCHGQLFPEMTGGVLYEHGHRLAATTVGFLQIALTVLLWRRRPALRRWAVGLLAAVCVQGTLGAVTVALKLPWIVSTAHLMLALSYFAGLLYVAWRTRPLEAQRADAEALPGRLAALGSRRWLVAGVALLAIQLVLGALVRHSEATLACVGMPDCAAGRWFPEAFAQRIHMIHRGFGVLVGVLTTVAAVAVYRRTAGWPALRRRMLVAPGLVLAQVLLGIYVVLTFRSVPVAVGHFAGATLLWALWVTAWFQARPGAAVVTDATPAEPAALAPVRGVHAVP